MIKGKAFDKYSTRGDFHWREFKSRDIRVYNAYHAARYEWILRMAGDVQGKRVLDAGCGDGLFTYILASKGARVTGVDTDPKGLELAREHIENEKGGREFAYALAEGSVTALPFPDESFDIVVSCEVIEHVSEPELMMRELFRVLRKGGVLALSTPYRLTETPQDPNHIKEYYPNEIERMLSPLAHDLIIKQTHHLFWRTLYTYPVSFLGRRELGRWLINALTLWFRWNPFLIDHTHPQKWDMFSNICIRGIKG